ncbi:MAG: hypothetical protein E6288_21830, partial [Enterobacteriaceae bacterium]|nr:hypothetical protein [Enterobacteriaceae bacterium]
MKIVILDGGVLNPGDLSWDALSQLGEISVYDNSAPEEVVERINHWGRYSFLGYDPKLELFCKNHKMTIKDGTTRT